MRFTSRLRIPTLIVVILCATALAVRSQSLLAQEDSGQGPVTRSATPIQNGLTGSFNQASKPYKYLFATGPIVIGGFNAPSSGCLRLAITFKNNSSSTQQVRTEIWNAPSGTLLSSQTNTLAADGFTSSFLGSIGTAAGCAYSVTSYIAEIYSTTASLALTGYINTDGVYWDESYRSAGFAMIHSGDFQRSVITSAFSFGSSAGVCATTPENSIKVSASNSFPGSPVFGDYGWQNSGSASNTDYCIGAAYADLFSRSGAAVSGAGKWTFSYQVPNGVYDVTVLYNTYGTPAGDTTITLNGRTIVNAVSTAAANAAQVNDRVNVGGNQILLGVSSASGTAVLNGLIITPVAQ